MAEQGSDDPGNPFHEDWYYRMPYIPISDRLYSLKARNDEEQVATHRSEP
jgi:hypothetical protein